jgi:hypothetical protein
VVLLVVLPALVLLLGFQAALPLLMARPALWVLL